jgi:hypothetical protein
VSKGQEPTERDRSQQKEIPVARAQTIYITNKVVLICNSKCKINIYKLLLVGVI